MVDRNNMKEISGLVIGFPGGNTELRRVMESIA